MDKKIQPQINIQYTQNINLKKTNMFPKTKDIPNDSFERNQDTMKEERIKNETENLKFKKVRIKYYPEDEEKMKSMSTEERIEYKSKLKAENKYINLDDTDKILTDKEEK